MSASNGGEAFRRIARRYFRAALFYLALGLLLGAVMLWFGNDNFQFLHGHMLLVGDGALRRLRRGVLVDRRAGGRGTAARRHPGPGQPSVLDRQRRSPGMLAGSVLPVGLGLDRIGVLFGFLEAAAGILFAVLLNRALKAKGGGSSGSPGLNARKPYAPSAVR